MKFSFPFWITVLNRFLSQVYLKEDSHHNVIEEIFLCHVMGENQ